MEIERCATCGAKPETSTYEPCDDFPGSLFKNHTGMARCLNCETSRDSGISRFATSKEAENAALERWNVFQRNSKEYIASIKGA